MPRPSLRKLRRAMAAAAVYFLGPGHIPPERLAPRRARDPRLSFRTRITVSLSAERYAPALCRSSRVVADWSSQQTKAVKGGDSKGVSVWRPEELAEPWFYARVRAVASLPISQRYTIFLGQRSAQTVRSIRRELVGRNRQESVGDRTSSGLLTMFIAPSRSIGTRAAGGRALD